MKKKISIIVPVFNAENAIERCINSIINQTIISKIEIIFVNDGSTDNSESIIKKYQKKYKDTIVLVNQKNSGPSVARNKGLSIAKGQYIGFVDADDYISFDMYEKMLNLIESEEDIDLVLTGRFDVINGKEKSLINESLVTGMSLHDDPNVLFKMSTFVWDKLYKLSIIKKFNLKFPENLSYAEDFYFLTLYKYYSKKIGVIKEPLYYYITQSNGSITNTCNERWYDIINALSEINNFFISEGIFEKYSSQLLEVSLGFFYRRLKNFRYTNNKKIQLLFVKKFYNYFNYYFANWKTELENYKTKNPKKYRTSYSLMAIYIYIPNFIKNFVYKLIKTMQRLKSKSVLYSYYRKFMKVKKNEVLFMSYFGGNITDSPYYMMKELLNDKKFNIYVASRNIVRDRIYLDFNGIKNVKIVKVHSKKFIKLLATAEFIVNNSRVPEYFTKRKRQILVNTWHGTPLKTLGRKMNKGLSDLGNNQNQFIMSDYLLYPNEYTKDLMMRDFCLDNIFSGKVILNGYPRNEIFFDTKRKNELRKKFGLENKKVYVYMPTWRGNTLDTKNIDKYKEDLEKILKYMDDNIKDAVVFVKLHQIIMNYIKINDYKNIKSVNSFYETYDFLNIADGLITDYSSVFFDFANTRREIILFMYDYDEYMNDRGMYFDVKKLPFTKVYTTNDLVKIINSKKDFKIDSNYKDFLDNFCKLDSKNNSKLVNDVIFRKKTLDIVLDYRFNSDKKYDIIFCSNLDNDNKKEEFKKIISTMKKDTLLVFQQRTFNDMTNDYIHENDDNIANYIVVPKNPAFTVLDRVIIKIYRKTTLLKFIVKKIYRKELDRILPNIKIGKIENYTTNKRFVDITKIFNR